MEKSKNICYKLDASHGYAPFKYSIAPSPLASVGEFYPHAQFGHTPFLIKMINTEREQV